MCEKKEIKKLDVTLNHRDELGKHGIVILKTISGSCLDFGKRMKAIEDIIMHVEYGKYTCFCTDMSQVEVLTRMWQIDKAFVCNFLDGRHPNLKLYRGSLGSGVDEWTEKEFECFDTMVIDDIDFNAVKDTDFPGKNLTIIR